MNLRSRAALGGKQRRQQLTEQDRGPSSMAYAPLGAMGLSNDGFSEGIDKGAAVSIYYKGNVVVNVWGGLADASIDRPWKEETFGHFWSGTKYLSSVVIAHLVERGLLDYEERVSKYWPEFAQNGKDSITLDSLLSHTAGLSVSKEDYKLSWLRDEPRRLSEHLASQTPLWTPGTRHGYSPFRFALHLNEIVKRVDIKERTLSQYFEEEIAKPFDLDLHIGLPKHLYHKSSRAMWRHISKDEIAKNMEKFEGDWDLMAIQMKQPSDYNVKTSIDDPGWADIGCGSTHGAGTAKTVARFAGIVANGGSADGKVMLTKKSIDKMLKPLSHGVDCIFSQRSTFARGVVLINAKQRDESWNIFGHSGYGGQIVLSDPRYKMGFAYCTNYMEPFANFHSNRWRHLLDAFYECASSIEGLAQEGHNNKVVLNEECGQALNDNNANSKDHVSSKL